MSIEYRDGSFSENMQLMDALERLIREIDTGVPVRAFHVGTEAELDMVKSRKELEDRVAALEANLPPSSKILRLPTIDEIKALIPPEVKP